MAAPTLCGGKGCYKTDGLPDVALTPLDFDHRTMTAQGDLDAEEQTAEKTGQAELLFLTCFYGFP